MSLTGGVLLSVEAFLGVPFFETLAGVVSNGRILRGERREGVPGTARDWLDGEGIAKSFLTRFLNCDLVSSSPGKIAGAGVAGAAGSPCA